MSVTSVAELPDGASSGWNRLWQRTYRRVYQVECNSLTDDEVTIRTALDGGSAPLLPRIGNAFLRRGDWVAGGNVTLSGVRDAGSFVQDVTTERTNANAAAGSCTWKVTVDYGPYDASTFSETPLEWPIKLSWGAQKYQRPTYRDVEDNAILNSASDPFGDQTTRDDSRSILTVTRNELCSTFDPLTPAKYRDRTNLNPWNGADAKTVKIASITTGDPVYDSNNQVWYYVVTYVFEENKDGWLFEPIDQGFNALDSSTPPRRKPIMNSGQPTQEAQLLDGSGKVLPSGGEPFYLSFEIYDTIDFDPLELDFTTRLGA